MDMRDEMTQFIQSQEARNEKLKVEVKEQIDTVRRKMVL
jgi:hypothetical protein